ncbi:MAG: hypothetical protein PHY29_02955 [Syntrophales bacterium]|nr:hypothetical protein [Syntrophales bacterium]
MELVQQKLVDLTPEMAENLLKINNYPVQRPLRERHLKDIIKAIEEDRFVGGEIATVKCFFDGGGNFLVNGQHQAEAVVRTGKTVSVVFKKFTVDSSEDLALLWQQFDHHAPRSLANDTHTEAYALGIQWPERISRLMVTGASLKEGKMDASKQEKVLLLKRYLRAGEAFAPLLEGDGARHLRRGPVVSAMLMTWEKNQEQCREFWSDVRDGENLKRSMAAYKLRDYLLSTNISRGMGARMSRSVTVREMLSKCIVAWNAYRKGESTALKYFPEKPVPKAV